MRHPWLYCQIQVRTDIGVSFTSIELPYLRVPSIYSCFSSIVELVTVDGSKVQRARCILLRRRLCESIVDAGMHGDPSHHQVLPRWRSGDLTSVRLTSSEELEVCQATPAFVVITKHLSLSLERDVDFVI